MEDKRLKDAFSNTSDRELQFTKEDRHRVFERIRKINEEPHTQRKSLISIKKLVPVTVSLLAIGLCLFLFLPSILSGNFNEESNSSDFNKVSRTPVASDTVVEEEKISTTLITVKSKEMDNQIYLNLLLTYNKDQKMMKVVTLPAETYAPVSTNNDGTVLYEKLLFAYQFGGAENVRTTVSKIFDLPIDYYAVIDLETFSRLIDSVNGIDYDLQEDIRVRAITQVAFDFEKGTHRLNGEEVVALMMSTSEFDKLGEEHLVDLMNAVMNKVENEIPPAQLKELFTKIEANVSLDSLLENQIEINSIKSISLKDGMIADFIPLSSTTGKFFYKFEKDFLNSISQELTTFN
ncbi:LCP family protein [Lysinibacillus xylanilyticus]|uniref:LCP family protein n=1 Tax=Lysinibacillus xylanilyticus TaxID=582475 RepID=A0ABV3VXP8_9BACI